MLQKLKRIVDDWIRLAEAEKHAQAFLDDAKKQEEKLTKENKEGVQPRPTPAPAAPPTPAPPAATQPEPAPVTPGAAPAQPSTGGRARGRPMQPSSCWRKSAPRSARWCLARNGWSRASRA